MTEFLAGAEAVLLVLAPIIGWLVIATGLAQSAIYLVELVVAFWTLRRAPPVESGPSLWAAYADVAPPISLLVPAYNEEATVVENVRSLLGLQYPRFEIVVINDGSKDATMARLIDAFELVPVTRAYEDMIPHQPIRGLYGTPRQPNLVVVDKANGGKADALNAGIVVSRNPLFCAVDADSLLEADSLLGVVQPFVEDPVRTVVSGGSIRIANGCEVRSGRVVRVGLPRQWLPLFQTVEYLRAFLMARLALSRMRALTIVSGAFGLFRRNVAVAVGGYSLGTVGEDLEIVVKIHRHLRDAKRDYRVVFVPEPVCWTEAPSDLGTLGRQRSRWQRGALETFFKHRNMLFRPRYGAVGTIGFGQMLLVDVIGPPVEVLGYVLIPLFTALGLLSVDYLIAFIALTFIYGVFVSVGSLVLEEIQLRRYPRLRDIAVLTLAAVAENFGYRQLNNWWRVVGWWRWLRKAEGWGRMARTGFRKG